MPYSYVSSVNYSTDTIRLHILKYRGKCILSYVCLLAEVALSSARHTSMNKGRIREREMGKLLPLMAVGENEIQKKDGGQKNTK